LFGANEGTDFVFIPHSALAHLALAVLVAGLECINRRIITLSVKN